jgi:glycosyltransferase involved in cell wall biosynthesis
MSNIAFLSSWNAVCGVAEFAKFLATEFHKNGHEITIFKNFFAGDYTEVPEKCKVKLGEEYPIFQTGFDPTNSTFFDHITFENEIHHGIDILIVNYQDYLLTNKPALNEAIRYCKKLEIKVFILFHDSCISPQLDLSLADYLVFPPSVSQFQAHSKAICIDQGIPEFNRNEFQYWEEAQIDESWFIGCFGMGRNKISDLVQIVDEINEEKVLSYPIDIGLNGRAGHYQEYENHPHVFLNLGYVEAQELASRLHTMHACVIWYPDIAQQSTSSAFRFAVGSKTPIICNRSNWVADQIGNGCWVEVEKDDPQLFKQAIIKTFQKETYPVLREKMGILQQKLIDQKGWSKIAKEYGRYF